MVSLEVIKGMHGLFYTPSAEEVHAFVREKLGFVHSDVGDGWLIFDMPEPIWVLIPRTECRIRIRSIATTFTRQLRS